MFNRWKPYPKYKPTEEGWYQCSIIYNKEQNKGYVMDLWWNKGREVWTDNRRLNVFDTYDVYGWGEDIIEKPIKKQLYYDDLCERKNVVAFKKLPKLYKPKNNN
jgi:hypothetical protein